ncbi:right-handed parallel beta-helix repeat-containing protein [Kitasatospora indigofera]|uniref:right-handed parallel beta-helix repeat-containing protein n=1 Tax=Kitasatospora indigofera TaxID=67307 RepID=UPI0036CEDE29
MLRFRPVLKAVLPVALAAATVAVPGTAHADSAYYVAPNGTASNPGTIGQPFGNINQFLAVAQPGDTVYVRGGTYSIGETYLTKSGTAGHDITIRNYPGETPVLDGGGTSGVAFYYGAGDQGAGNGSYVTIDGFVIRNYWRSGINLGCCTADGSLSNTVSHVTIRNNVIDRTGQNGITFMGGSDITVQHNLVGRTGWDAGTGSWSSGINLWGMYGGNNVVDGNVTYHNVDVSGYHTDGNGIIVDLSYYNGSARITNNVSFENGGAGIQLTNSSGGTVVNNTLYENGKEPTYIYGGTGLGFYGSEAFDHATVRNNVVRQSFGNGLNAPSAFTNSVLSNNDIQGQSGYQDPQFTAAGSADFSTSASSPVVNAGTSTDAPGTALVFDSHALLHTTSNQPISWFEYAPDFSYIGSHTVAALFGSVSRPQGGGVDQGAFEASGGTNPTGANLIGNGEFDNGTAGWWSWFDSSASGSISTVGGAGLSGANSLKVSIGNGSSADWTAQAGQTVPGLTAGTTYTLKFTARADAARTITVSAQQEASPYATYLSSAATLSTTAQTFTRTFTASASGSAYVKFNVGGSNAAVYVDAVSLTAS